MGIKYDCASSILLCAEDSNNILAFDEEEAVERHLSDWTFHPQNFYFSGRFFMDFPLLSDECIDLLIKTELEHLPREDYAKRLISGSMDFSVRRDAIDWILNVHAYHNFGPLSAYLSVNYLDRFLSSSNLPQGKVWMTQLLSVACLSLASKMEKTEVPLLLDLQVGETKFVFEARAIQRMELLLLSTLKWRMQAVTPFSFIDYFLHKLNGDYATSKISVARAVELILFTIRGIDFLKFRPSEIAMGAALSVMGAAQPLDAMETITCFYHIDKERVLSCYEMIQEEILSGCTDQMSEISSILSLPQSPIGVLDAACLSNKSDESSPAAKRRKASRSSTSIKDREMPFLFGID